jgi:hypothetical protein
MVHLITELWTPIYAWAWKIPLALEVMYVAWRALLNRLRRDNVCGLDRRCGDDRRQSVAPVDVEHRTGRDRRRPPRYARLPASAED